MWVIFVYLLSLEARVFTRLLIELSDLERTALEKMAARELRGLRDQARWLIVRGLETESVGATNAKPAKPEPTDVHFDHA